MIQKDPITQTIETPIPAGKLSAIAMSNGVVLDPSVCESIDTIHAFLLPEDAGRWIYFSLTKGSQSKPGFLGRLACGAIKKWKGLFHDPEIKDVVMSCNRVFQLIAAQADDETIANEKNVSDGALMLAISKSQQSGIRWRIFALHAMASFSAGSTANAVEYLMAMIHFSLPKEQQEAHNAAMAAKEVGRLILEVMEE